MSSDEVYSSGKFDFNAVTNPPTLFLHSLIDWKIEDPKGRSIENVREIRDEIEQRVKELVTNLQTRQEINI